MSAESAFSASALRNARALAGLSLADLAARAGVARQYLNHLECGRRTPSPSVLSNVATALGVPSQFLQQSVPVVASPQAAYFRSLTRTPKRERERALAVVDLLALLVARFEEDLQFPHVDLPEVVVRGPADIEAAALECRRLLGLGTEAPIRNLTRAVERAGIVVADIEGVDAAIDSFAVRASRQIVVRSTCKGSASRERLSLAHELGHLVMHRNASTNDAAIEREAQMFAGALLFPADAFRREFVYSSRSIWPHLFQLKARWGVAATALLARAVELGLIPKERSTGLWAHASRRGWRRAPEPDEPAHEQPELLLAAFRELHRSRAIAPLDLAHELGWDEVLLQRVVGGTVYAELRAIGAPPVLLLSRRVDPPTVEARQPRQDRGTDTGSA